MITIRPARLSEVKQLQNLNDEAFVDNPKFDPDLVLDWAQSDLGEAYFIGVLNSSEDACFVAEDSNRLVGYISASPKEIEYRKSRYIEIDNLGVTPAYQKQGIATMLMDACLEWAKSKGYQKVMLSCYVANAGALEFYKKKGFLASSISLEKTL